MFIYKWGRDERGIPAVELVSSIQSQQVASRLGRHFAMPCFKVSARRRKNPRYRGMADSALIFPMGHIRCIVGPTLDPTLLLFELQPAIATIAAMIQAA
jgi:hypothetical protein